MSNTLFGNEEFFVKMLFIIIVMLSVPLCLTILMDFSMGYSLQQAIMNPIHSFSVMQSAEKVLLFLLMLALLVYKIMEIRRKKKMKG